MLRLLLTLLALVACSPELPLDVGYHGSDEGLVAARAAATAWREACGAELVNVRRGDGEIDVYEYGGTVEGQAFGVTLSRPPLFGPARAYEIHFMAGSYALPVLAHEYGHALGLQHAPSGIMQPGAQWLVLDPETDRRTLRPGTIAANECAAALRGGSAR